MLRIVFEFDQDAAEITPELLLQYWAVAADGGAAAAEVRLLGLESELALAAAVQAQPPVLRQLWLEEARRWIYRLGDPEPFIDLIDPAVEPVDLYPLTAGLSAYARGYFEENRTNGNDADALARWLQVLRLRRLTVEDDEGPLLASDYDQ
ncbi:hypothetical protein [Hymenobacter nivis]|uniref:Uncharacterized protein n=1 Tax=Hymenobacter nivis TaxID=1850093 RepID=A0A502G7Z1_9BACT|nr:hypothetical protein [Hymenobacter nivis]TPG57999.1 hypothetical protein EAH73_22665 [Hymenobacter nivis]